MIPPIGDVTTDGYDLQFGTNVLGNTPLPEWYVEPHANLSHRSFLFDTTAPAYPFVHRFIDAFG